MFTLEWLRSLHLRVEEQCSDFLVRFNRNLKLSEPPERADPHGKFLPHLTVGSTQQADNRRHATTLSLCCEETSAIPESSAITALLD